MKPQGDGALLAADRRASHAASRVLKREKTIIHWLQECVSELASLRASLLFPATSPAENVRQAGTGTTTVAGLDAGGTMRASVYDV